MSATVSVPRGCRTGWTYLRLAAQHRLLNQLGDSPNLEAGRKELGNAADEAGEHVRLEVGGADDRGADCACVRGWLVEVAQLFCQALVEGESGRFRGAVCERGVNGARKQE